MTVAMISVFVGVAFGGCASSAQPLRLEPRTQENVGELTPDHMAALRHFNAEWIERRFVPLEVNHPLARTVDAIGQRLTAAINSPGVSFRVLNESAYENMFAGVGGPVYVTSGLLARLRSKAEAAAVLAHQLAHVSARHKVDDLLHGLRTARGLAHVGEVIGDVVLVGILAPLNFDPLPVKAVYRYSRFSVARREADMMERYATFIYGRFSETDEREADQLALGYLQRARLDPAGLLAFVRRTEYAAARSDSNPPVFAVTHGHARARLAALQRDKADAPRRREP